MLSNKKRSIFEKSVSKYALNLFNRIGSRLLRPTTQLRLRQSYYIRHNGTRHNGTQHNDAQHIGNQHNGPQNNYTIAK